MEGLVVLNKENSVAAAGDKPHIQRTTRASIANPARQKLADISNLPRPTRNTVQDGKSSLMPIPPADYINQLQKENMTLLKIVEERNKLIEVTGIELKKLRINLQKMQQQNLQLAQSYTQVLAELNSSKDRHKALQHELGCLNGILKAKNLEVQGKIEVKSCKVLNDEVDHTNGNIGEESTADMENGKHKNTKRRPQSKSLGSCGQVELKDKDGSKRLCKRRQSAKFELEEPSPSDDSFPTDIEVLDCQPSNDSLQTNDSTSSSIALKDSNAASGMDAKHERPPARRRSARFQPVEPMPSEDLLGIPEEKVPVCSEQDAHPTCSSIIAKKEDVSVSEEPRRCSLNRPSRQAAKKVKTYKEIPLKAKMRRE